VELRAFFEKLCVTEFFHEESRSFARRDAKSNLVSVSYKERELIVASFYLSLEGAKLTFTPCYVSLEGTKLRFAPCYLSLQGRNLSLQ